MKPTDADATQGTSPLSPRLRKAAPIVGGVVLLLVGLLLGRWTSPAPADSPVADQADTPSVWTCSMHPQIQSPNPGQCPLCGMDLIPVTVGGDDTGPRELKLTASAATLAGIETEPVRRREVAREVRMVGMVDYDETRLDYITAWIPGRLDRMFVDYTGVLVHEGDHLVEIYSPQLLSAQEELLQAIQTRTRLLESGSQLLRETAEQTVRSAREKLRLWGLGLDQIAEIERTGQTADHITIRAPTGGVVVHKNKNTGDYVNIGDRVYTIADLTRVWIKLDAYESDLSWVRYGQTVNFETESYPGVPFEGQVVFVDPVLTGGTRTVKVRLNVDNQDGRLKPGMFVRAVLNSPLQADGQTLDPSLAGKWVCPMHWDEIRDTEGACDQCGMPLVRAETLQQSGDPSEKHPLVVPATAVLWTGVRSLVYVREPGEELVFRGQEIVLGPRAGAFYVVREGLEEGQLVVTKGAFKIDSALQIEARPSMMLPPEGSVDQPRQEASAAFLEALDPVFLDYLDAQAGLTMDDAEEAKAAARALSSTVRGVDMTLVTGPGHVAWMSLASRLREAAHATADAGSVDEARAGFEALSSAILDLERQFGHREGVLHEAFCPMAFDNKGASWLQEGEEIKNPYMGSSMPRCGEIRATFPAQEDPASPGHETHEGGDEHADHGADGTEPSSRPASQPVEVETPGQGAHLDRFRQQLDGIVVAYFGLQKDLADDKATAAIRVPEIRRALEAVDASSLSSGEREDWRSVRAPALLADLGRLEESVSLEAQRQAFEPLSTTLNAIVARYGHAPRRTVRRFHCPMAFGNRGADWLQEGEQTLNPYFGSGMLRCGRQVEVLPAEGGLPEGGQVWTCSMHPQVRLGGPGACPLCGMDLLLLEEPAGEGGDR
jgi:membrane fusion protein, copper/silver efflux system